MLLKLKAKLYQYTGIYLARKEQNTYMKSPKAKQDIEELMGIQYNGRLSRGITIGLWQGSNGLISQHTGIWVPSRGKLYKRLYYKTLNRIMTIYLQFKVDIGL